MKILFLSHYFPPEVNAPASRTFEHCTAWVEAGHEVTVVTCAPNHPRGVVYDGFRNRLWQKERRNGIEVIRLWTFLTANEGFLKRTLNYLSFMFATIVAAPFLARADVVITTSPQFFNGLAGYPVSRMKRIPWVLEIRDLWPESIVTVGALRNGLLIRLLESLEMFAYRRSDALVPVTDSFRRYMISRGIPAGKIEVIKNGADLSLFEPHSGANPLREELGLQGRFVASYFGTHGMAHKLDTILEAAQLLTNRHDIVFLLAGDGAERARLLELRKERGLDNVVMLGQQPRSRMPLLWDLSDVSLVLLKDSPLFASVIPSKIFESMAMARPIIAAVRGETAEIIAAAKAGVCIEPEDAQALAEAVVKMAADPPSARVLGDHGREYVSAHFDRRILASRFETLLRRVVRGPAPGPSAP